MTSTRSTSSSSTAENHAAVRSSTSIGTAVGALMRNGAYAVPNSGRDESEPAGRPRARVLKVLSRRTASRSSNGPFPSSGRAKRCSRSSTSASIRRSGAGSTSAATTSRASPSANPSDRTASASSSRPTTKRSFPSGAPSWRWSAGSTTACSPRTSSSPSRSSTKRVELLDTLNVLGHIGLTAYLGVTEVAKPRTG